MVIEFSVWFWFSNSSGSFWLVLDFLINLDLGFNDIHSHSNFRSLLYTAIQLRTPSIFEAYWNRYFTPGHYQFPACWFKILHKLSNLSFICFEGSSFFGIYTNTSFSESVLKFLNSVILIVYDRNNDFCLWVKGTSPLNFQILNQSIP